MEVWIISMADSLAAKIKMYRCQTSGARIVSVISDIIHGKAAEKGRRVDHCEVSRCGDTVTGFAVMHDPESENTYVIDIRAEAISGIEKITDGEEKS